MESFVRLTADDIDRWNCEVMPFPLPSHLVPKGGIPLADLSRDVLRNAPPQLIAHVQRTAAQGGLQIISPRQTPVTSLMLRSTGGDRQLGDHVVGSIADPSMEWPTIDDMDFSDLLPDQPLPGIDLNKAVSEKTRTEPITRAGRLLSDPILSCLVKGRAVIDILRREDVSGGAEAMTEVLAKAWGISVKELDDMDAFTLGVQGPLLRHAIKADEVFPMCYAPIHIRRSISTGVNEVSRELLPVDSAMDWRRMRVCSEAIFLMTCDVEGHPVKKMRCFPPPGDPSARTDRPGVMTFLPAPATAWSFAASTFSMSPTSPLVTMQSAQIPKEVLEALARYTKLVRPVSYAMSVGHRAATQRSLTMAAEMPYGETISEAYRLMARTMMVGSARGKTAAATVRNLIYKAIESAPLSFRMRIARYLSIATQECKIHLGSEVVPDLVVDKIANKFVEAGDLIRMHVVGEAARRGATAEEWWSDILSQAPASYRMMSEGTRGWARIGMWMVFRAPTERWTGLVKAVKYSALREAGKMSVGSLPLPPEKGSKERLIVATRAACASITKSYAAYYIGVSDVGLAVADVLDERGKHRSADTLREASYLWTLRARCLRGTNVNAIARTEPTPASTQLRIYTDPVDLILTPTPYRGFQAYVKHVEASDLMPKAIKRHFREYESPYVSRAFTCLDSAILPAKKSTVTLYLLDPKELGRKMEQAWAELTADIRAVAAIYGASEAKPKRKAEEVVIIPNPEMAVKFATFPKPSAKRDYYAVIGELDEDKVEWIENILERIPTSEAEEIYDMEFDGPGHLINILLGFEKEYIIKLRKTDELVR